MIKNSNKIELIIKELVQDQIKTRADLDSFKRKMAKKYKIPCLANVELLRVYHKLVRTKRVRRDELFEELLRTRPIRSLSGVVNVSVLTKPYPCPGECIFCPQEKGLPKSYLRGEPAVERAIFNKFNPYLQVQTRLKSLKETSHPIDKIELRIIGGTWSYYPKRYQAWFVKECFRAASEFTVLKNYAAAQKFNSKKLQKKILDKKAMAELSSIEGLGKELVKHQKKNERAKCRIIGITVETRPDYINIKEIKRMRGFGITRVELGVQSIYDDILKLNKRGHGVAATIKATRLLKDAGFKVSYQMMPNLPGSNLKRDTETFEELFSNPDFKPDLLKIYPLALVKQAPLSNWYKQRKYKPYCEKKLIELLIENKKTVPYWCRIERIVRDIPSVDILEGGAKISNLREVVLREMRKRGLKCKCIRCREVGKDYDVREKLYLFREDYKASGGKEIFLSFASKRREKLYALLRLRIPSQYSEIGFQNIGKIFPVLKNAAIIREIHTYGQMSPIYRGQTTVRSPQHKGLGKKLIKEAEKIAKEEFGLNKIVVISGVGVRSYYRKLGYKLKDTYMVKRI